MDPDKALQKIVEAVADGDRDSLEEHLDALAGWLRVGGRMPAPPAPVGVRRRNTDGEHAAKVSGDRSMTGGLRLWPKTEIWQVVAFGSMGGPFLKEAIIESGQGWIVPITVATLTAAGVSLWTLAASAIERRKAEGYEQGSRLIESRRAED